MSAEHPTGAPATAATPQVAVIVLAAGEGKRMRSSTPKVLHEIAGRSLLGHVLAAAAPLQASTTVVVGVGRDQVIPTLPQAARHVVQDEQRGTGHAARIALDALPDLPEDATVVILAGDTPLLRAETIAGLVAQSPAVLTAVLDDPTGYGRVLTDGRTVTAIVEHRDATDEQRAIREVNTGVFALPAGPLRKALSQLTTDNDQGEEYLTDVVPLLGLPMTAVVATDPTETWGINDRAQLADAEAVLRSRINRQHMRNGVRITDPLTAYIDVDVALEPDATVLPGTSLRGSTTVAAGAVVGPHSSLTDTQVAAGACVDASTCIGAVVGPDATVGPYSFLRPGAVLHRGAKVGAYVEVKASTIGEESKVPHLSYVGDATVGKRSNIGAATVTVNYDGVAKHRTVVGDDVRVGSDTMLVAPVTIGDGAYTAAGSVITEDVPAGALGVGRARQVNKEGWVARARRRTGPSSDAGNQSDPEGTAP